MIRFALIALALLAAPAFAQDSPVRFHSEAVEPEMGQNGLLRPVYFVSFVAENVSPQVVTGLDVVIVGRDNEQTIVETERVAIIGPPNLPNGLQPGEQFAVRHRLPQYNPTRTVTSVEIQMGRIFFAD